VIDGRVKNVRSLRRALTWPILSQTYIIDRHPFPSKDKISLISMEVCGMKKERRS
jgi:hypothetical protein